MGQKLGSGPACAHMCMEVPHSSRWSRRESAEWVGHRVLPPTLRHLKMLNLNRTFQARMKACLSRLEDRLDTEVDDGTLSLCV